MNDAIRIMLERYECRSREEYLHALREILQQVALLGLWRSKFFEHAAFYGGTALRVLHGLDRYSEDLDFSLLTKNDGFSLGAYGDALQREVESFGFPIEFESRRKQQEGPVDSAFLKTNTFQQLVLIGAGEDVLNGLNPDRKLRIRLEVDRDPPPGFDTEAQYILQPIPFAVRAYTLPDLFAGKLHAVLCRKWKTRVKGRDWYDLVWYIGRHPEVHLSHLESRMRQSGDYGANTALTMERLQDLLHQAIDELNVEQARHEVSTFIRDQRALEVWSREFFRSIVQRIKER